MPRNTFNAKFLAVTQRPLDLSADQLIELVCKKKAKKNNRRPNTFAIMMTDRGARKKYLKELKKKLNEYPQLIGQEKTFWGKRNLNHIEIGDFIVFGDASRSFKYDYRVETDIDNVQEATGKFYDLVHDWDLIVAAIRRYKNKKYGVSSPKKSPRGGGNVNVNVTVNVNGKKAKNKKSRGWQQAQVFNNYVKVGFDQYDIFEDVCGNEYVTIGGATLAIAEDAYGNRLLVQ